MNNIPETIQQADRKSWKFWLGVCGAWVVIGTLFTVQSYYYRNLAGGQPVWWDLYPREVLYFIFWALFTPAVLWLARRFQIDSLTWIRRIPQHIGIGIFIAALQRMAYDGLIMTLRATPEKPFSPSAFWNSVVGFTDYGFFIYFIVLFIAHAAEYNRRFLAERLTAVRLKEELASAQLQALRMQLHPHFLFNTLNTISVLIREEPDRAATIVEEFSDLLRLTLQAGTVEEIPLHKEIDFLSLYLRIEQIRFGDRMTVRYDCDESVLGALVPTFILQPLVENAIKHGIGKRREMGSIEISARRTGNSVRIEVVDNGGDIPERREDFTGGIGLSNTRARLHTLYQGNATLSLERRDGHTVASVIIPYHGLGE